MFNSVVKSLIYNTISIWNGITFFKPNTDPIVDLFYKIRRDSNYSDISKLANESWEVSPLLTLKIIAYTRDCRGGKGERQCGRNLLKWLAHKSPENMIQNIQFLIVECGRYDDLIALLDTPCEQYMFEFVSNQLEKDLDDMNHNRSISLLAKWIPSERKSIDNSTKFYKKLVKHMKITPRTLRKKYLSPLRAYLKIVEIFMCSNKWNQIEFDNVPSRAMQIYSKNAFEKHIPEKFIEYKSNKRSVTKLCTALYPHEIIKYYNQDPAFAETQWKQIIQICNDYSTIKSAIVLPDIKSNINDLSTLISTTVGLFISELSNNEFKNMILTFENNPQFYHLQGDTLHERHVSIKNAPREETTNICSALELILNSALDNNLSAEQMPKRLIIISDMQLQEDDNRWILNYKRAGYAVPHITLWNINEQIDDVPIIKEQNGILLIKGFNVDILRSVITGNNVPTPYETVLNTVNISNYDPIAFVQTL